MNEYNIGMSAIDSAVAYRFNVIKNTLKHKQGEYIYSVFRTLPSSLGWRFRQNLGMRESWPNSTVPFPDFGKVADATPEAITAGDFDECISYTWHDAAAAEWWYRYEKQWD